MNLLLLWQHSFILPCTGPQRCHWSVWLPVKIARRQKEVLKTHYPLDVSSQKSTKVCFSMTIGILKFPDPRNRDSISVINSKDTLLAILKVTDARRDVILAGGLNHHSTISVFKFHDFLNKAFDLLYSLLTWIFCMLLQTWYALQKRFPKVSELLH